MKPLVKTEKLSLRFGGVIGADNIDFELYEGESLAVIGQNGAGKTTFINICTGFLKPDAGKVYFDDRDITSYSPRKIVRLGLGRSFQLPQLFTEHTVRECIELSTASREGNLTYFKSLNNSVVQDEVEETLRLVGLSADSNKLSADLPEGKRKLLDVAMALALKPKLLIMDEPTSGVAAEEKHGLMTMIMDALAQRKVTSWFVEHDEEIVEKYSTRVAAWISGRIVADGTPSEVLNNPMIRTEVLGEQ